MLAPESTRLMFTEVYIEADLIVLLLVIVW